MALRIAEDCINCDLCEPECPNEAIAMGDSVYQIDPERCTECVGHYDEPNCMTVCPIDCIEPDPERIENKVQLLQKFNRLH
ncbi:YfhL family 4Fe-4S dicluster ferredoxin [Aestuariibacter halophilus]|uniref:YfhL family 4Fe-4S dicluster ferredoxin n=1 Tax=Fluctibacter halophilus TaxID=226011 RepID=A0ABS8GBU2_9ALTE|nr:YfhL family 4Fe-4S dicluster ferredoxin [Aestuariibacter halophilus]MCC2617968.1 YfhL family 4Fe-4S dicluster ferredoxin [Aestuariibacter halophilus]